MVYRNDKWEGRMISVLKMKNSKGKSGDKGIDWGISKDIERVF
jgi:hypothetical protein